MTDLAKSLTFSALKKRKVRRVPPPQTSTADVLNRFKEHRKAEAAAFLAERPCSTKSCHNPATVDGLCGSCRWPGVAAERWPGLETLLAQQVASGGQSGAAARAMLVMREEALRLERSRHVIMAGELGDGIRGLKLERPLIAYKRAR